MSRTLIIYATRKGTTENTARVIGETLLLKYSHSVDLTSIKNIRSYKKTLKEYDTIIVGSSIIRGRWVGRALRFLKRTDFGNTKIAIFITAGGTLRKESIEGISRTDAIKQAIEKYIDPYLKKFSFEPVSTMAFGGMVVRRGLQKYSSWNRSDIESWAMQLNKIMS